MSNAKYSARCRTPLFSSTAAALKQKPPLPKAPRADTAPVEGKEVRSDQAGGFGQSARQMDAVRDTGMHDAHKTIETPAPKAEKPEKPKPKKPKDEK